MTKRPASSRVRDGLLALVALVALIGFAIVVATAPKEADAPGSGLSTTPTSPVTTENVDDDSGSTSPSASTPRTTPAPTPSPKPTPTPTPKPSGGNDRGPRRTSDDAQVAQPETKQRVADTVSCAEVTAGPTPVRCITRKRKRTVVLGGLGAPVGLSGGVVSVQQVDVIASGKRGVVRLRLRGGISLPPSARGVLRRSEYYFGAGERRFRAVGGGTGLRAPVVGEGSRYRVSFDLPRATFTKVSRPGVSTRFVWAPPGVDVLGMEPVGVIALNLSAAIR